MPTPPTIVEEKLEPSLILYGNDRGTWERILPELQPLCLWAPEADTLLIRWHMPAEMASKLGVSKDTSCANPGCGCKPLLEAEGGGFLIDTNWRQTKFFFEQ